MADKYLCRYGNRRRTRKVRNYDNLLTISSTMKEDDGLRVELPPCDKCADPKASMLPHICPRVAPVCADCGKGTLTWAEAGYVPWHRICNVCGSHWDLHPGPNGYYRRARFY